MAYRRLRFVDDDCCHKIRFRQVRFTGLDFRNSIPGVAKFCLPPDSSPAQDGSRFFTTHLRPTALIDGEFHLSGLRVKQDFRIKALRDAGVPKRLSTILFLQKP